MDKQEALNELKRKREIAYALGGPERVARHRERGHLTARERLDKLLDPGTWRETGLFAQFKTDDGKEYHANKIHGFGKMVLNHAKVFQIIVNQFFQLVLFSK